MFHNHSWSKKEHLCLSRIIHTKWIQMVHLFHLHNQGPQCLWWAALLRLNLLDCHQDSIHLCNLKFTKNKVLQEDQALQLCRWESETYSEWAQNIHLRLMKIWWSKRLTELQKIQYRTISCTDVTVKQLIKFAASTDITPNSQDTLSQGVWHGLKKLKLTQNLEFTTTAWQDIHCSKHQSEDPLMISLKNLKCMDGHLSEMKKSFGTELDVLVMENALL